MKILSSLILSFILVGLWSCSDAGDPLSNDCTEELDCAGACGGTATVDECGECDGNESTCNISFSATIQPILSPCTSCHGSSVGGLNLSSYDNLMAGTSNHGPVVMPFESENSVLIQKLSYEEPPFGNQMPQNGPYLDAATINLIETWIDEGAQNN